MTCSVHPTRNAVLRLHPGQLIPPPLTLQHTPPSHQIGTPPCIKDILIPYFSVFNVVKVFKRLMPSYESSDWMISVQAVASRSDQRVAAAPHAFSGTRALLPTDVHAVAMRFASYLLQLAVLVPFIGVWVTNLNDTVPIMWFVFFT